MTPTKASPTVPMPEQRFPSVRALFCETKMSDRDFRIFTGNIRYNAIKHLDDSGISVEEQDPAALRHFLNQIKKSDPTIARRYPYLWPVLAYLELYLNGRRRNHHLRHYGDAPPRPARRRVLSSVPIWIRFARSEKTGKSLQEITEVELDKCPPVSRSTPRRTRRRRPTEKRNAKKEPEPKVDESITQPIDNSPTGPSNRITAPVSYFLRSFGSSIGSICAHLSG